MCKKSENISPEMCGNLFRWKRQQYSKTEYNVKDTGIKLLYT